MSYIGQKDLFLEIARGNVPGITHVNKFGENTSVDSGVDSDIWDLVTQPIWLAPTAARIHAIVSTDASDDGSPAGRGCRTIRVYGLTSWSSAEVSEDITLNGTSSVNTSNSYVIIHRMKMLTCGDLGPNAGIITATAASDSTITAEIRAGEGQTQMAIYGIPSTQTGYMTNFYASAVKAAVGASVSLKLLVCTVPGSEEGVFTTKSTAGLATGGSNYIENNSRPYRAIPGPAIVKIQANSSSNGTNVSAGFDLILVDN